jgi:hypothetical protein
LHHIPHAMRHEQYSPHGTRPRDSYGCGLSGCLFRGSGRSRPEHMTPGHTWSGPSGPPRRVRRPFRAASANDNRLTRFHITHGRPPVAPPQRGGICNEIVQSSPQYLGGDAGAPFPALEMGTLGPRTLLEEREAGEHRLECRHIRVICGTCGLEQLDDEGAAAADGCEHDNMLSACSWLARKPVRTALRP